MVEMKHDDQFWSGRRVLITGHTGFKGSWLAFYLRSMGAQLCGYSLEPSERGIFVDAEVSALFEQSVYADILDRDSLEDCLRSFRPSVVFHLAAQALVRVSYNEPINTVAVNVIGTANLLDIARSIQEIEAIVNVTSDKCYVNNEWVWPYRETDRLGGHDLYSASKACSEIISSAFSDSFFNKASIATARAGNVMGGGDWSKDRLVPDIIRSIEKDRALVVRAPESVRPWQHVLDANSGYIHLAEFLVRDPEQFSGAWNFGPKLDGMRNVKDLVGQFSQIFTALRVGHCDEDLNDGPHEAKLLALDISKSVYQLKWSPTWQFERAVEATADWYQAYFRKEDMHEFTFNQVESFLCQREAASVLGLEIKKDHGCR